MVFVGKQLKETYMNSYELSRKWFDFCFENPDKIKPNHTALYFFAIEHCNRLGWKEKFGFPTTMVMEAIGIRSYNTYINTLNEVVLWGFIEMIERSKNQYSANIIALSNFDKALNKALDKALIKHTTKQSESIDSIDKQDNNKPLNNKQVEYPFDSKEFFDLWLNWKDYKKKEFKFNYKSIQSEQAALIQLSNLSNGDLDTALKIINQSFSNGWKGFFELKGNGTNKRNNQTVSDDRITSIYAEKLGKKE